MLSLDEDCGGEREPVEPASPVVSVAVAVVWAVGGLVEALASSLAGLVELVARALRRPFTNRRGFGAAEGAEDGTEPAQGLI